LPGETGFVVEFMGLCTKLAPRRVSRQVPRREEEIEMNIQFTMQVWLEGDRYVAYAKELDVSTSGRSVAEAKTRLHEAVEGFLEEAERMGTLEQLLDEAGYVHTGDCWEAPEIVAIERTVMTLPRAHA
jgi:predicted RNase H-like HicB family nuclease